MRWFAEGRMVIHSSPMDLRRSKGRLVLIASLSPAGCYASQSAYPRALACSTISLDIFVMSPGVALCSSRISPRGAHTALTSCHSLPWRTDALFLRARLRRQNTSLRRRTCQSGHDRSSACTFHLLLSPRTSLPRGVCRRKTAPWPTSHRRLACSSRSSPLECGVR